jgi:hypothetical protein
MMDRAFPFGFPGPTAFYLTLYVLTLIVHVIFMNYVLAGTGYLAIAAVGRWLKRRRGGEPERDVVFDILRDWMPFGLGAAITAAVAPLLFLQILYKEQFYTANLLLFHRWMSILPVLIVGFYLLYLMRSKWLEKRSAGALVWAALGALTCFAFTGYAWSENHLLSLDRASWPGHYESRAMFYRNPLVAARFLMWAAGSVATMATILGGQIAAGGGLVPGESRWAKAATRAGAARRIAKLALAGIVVSFAAGSAYWWLQSRWGIEKNAACRFQEPLTRPYFYLAVVGALVQSAAWFYVLQRGRHTSMSLGTASIGLLATILGATVLREAIRLQAIDISKLYEQHADAAQIGGWWVFVLFVVVNATLIAWSIRIVRRRKPDKPA